MTAEVAILNKSAAALAADSAVTTGYTGREKVFTSANKIFALSKHAPVGVMIYGHVDHCLVPWETIIKDIRRQLGTATFPHIDGYVDFIKKCISVEFYLTQESQHLTVLAACMSAYYMMEITLEEHNLEKNAQNIEIVFEIMKDIFDTYPILDEFNDHTVSEFTSKYGSIITEYFTKRDIFDAELPEDKHEEFTHIVFESLSHAMPSRFSTGVVVSGFGDAEMFPTLHQFQVDGVIFDKCRILPGTISDIDRSKNPVFVKAFAQDDVVNSFLHGVDELYQKHIFGILKAYMMEFVDEVLDSHTSYGEEHKAVARSMIEKNLPESIGEIENAMLEFCDENYKSPIKDVLRVAPKEELAHVAESLVSLTALKRRVAGEVESVGGPIDVAVISKGDGLVWIKRKHYFDPELNHHFFKNYFKR